VNLFLDTSGLIKIYHQERGSDKLHAFLREHSANLAIVISDLGVVEFHSAILRLERMKELEATEGKRVRSLFRSDVDKLRIQKTDEHTMTEAIALLENVAETQPLKTLDALQVASALLFHNQSTIDFFVSSDKNQLAVAQKYFPTLNPLEM
jgi:predicted nucleic acid-binding protein